MKSPTLPLAVERVPVLSRRPSWAGVAGFLKLSLRISGALGLLTLLAGFAWQFDRFLRRSDFFALARIEIVGASAVLEAQLREALAIGGAPAASNLLSLDAAGIAAGLERLPRLRAARILKQYPATLRVEVQERVPFVAVLLDELYWMDADGVLLGPVPTEDWNGEAGPILTGLRELEPQPGRRLRQARLPETLRALRYLADNDPRLGARFAEWHLTADDEIVGVLKEGIEVRFGPVDPLTKMAVLAAVLRARPNLSDLRCLDLRFEGQVVYF